MHTNLINIKEISKRFNITPYTINHYTNLGLLKVVMKNKNKRLYNEADVVYKLKTISTLIAEGYPLQLIRKRLDNEVT
ncbi:MAG: MerR family transcriptional regulator [Candidatus Omnitrophica bacterium]|nr:MerR family transcriptional regulator [Candidatus Omnitrophota bacterium]MDD5436815.1 MerR family transcriptional regulator [Candidatus Omnitrophota bacterium]